MHLLILIQPRSRSREQISQGDTCLHHKHMTFFAPALSVWAPSERVYTFNNYLLEFFGLFDDR